MIMMRLVKPYIKRSVMKKSMVLILIAMLGFAGFYYFRQKPSEVQSSVIYVDAIKIKETSVPLEIEAIGSLKAKQIEISPEISGHVHDIIFKDGLSVEKNTPLIKLDDAIYKAKYQSAKAQLAFSESDYKRKIYLEGKGVIAKQAIEQALSDLKEKAAYLEEAKVMLEKTTLRAPFSGILGKSEVNRGDYVTNGQHVVTLTDTKHLRVEYDVPEKFFPLLKMGQRVMITTSTYPDKQFEGKISYRSPTVNAENRAISLYAEIDNEKNELAPGMFVHVTQHLGQDQHAVLVPARSLVPILDGEQIYKIQSDKAYPVTVTIGKHYADKVQILAGLSVGDTIITDGQLKIRNGSLVKIKD